VTNGDFLTPIWAAYVASDKHQANFVGTDHTVVVQALIENLSNVLSITGPDPSGLAALQAMLQIPSIPDSTKNIIREILLIPQGQMSAACQYAATAFQGSYPAGSNLKAQVAYLKQQESIKSPCMQFHVAVEDGLAIADAGKSTIYNNGWVNTHLDGGSVMRPGVHFDHWSWKKTWIVAAADVGGAVVGVLLGDGWGALAGCAAASVACACATHCCVGSHCTFSKTHRVSSESARASHIVRTVAGFRTQYLL